MSNILFFASRLKYGGGEKVRNWLAKVLAENGFSVYYATSDSSSEYLELLGDIGLKNHVHVVYYNPRIKKYNPFGYYGHICKLYNDNNISAIIYFGGSLIEQFAAKKCGVKILLSERFYNGFRPLASRILKHIQYRIADGYVFQTPEASKTYSSRAECIGTIIPNPIIDKLPEPIFENLRKEIVTAGRLMPQKNHKMLIDAFNSFHKKHSDYKLIIYGSGPLKDDLNKQINQYGLKDYVSIISGKTNISDLERGAELFVLSSFAEGMPNALIEAMSVGVLCISTDCPVYGSRMLIQHGVNGFLVPVSDSEKLSQIMCQAVENPDQANRIRHEAVKIKEILNEEKIAVRWIQYIHTLMLK